jgi:chaperone BCS1
LPVLALTDYLWTVVDVLRVVQHGEPGSGKTSVIHSLAGELGLHVYIISLSCAGLDDNMLSASIAQLPPRCIALMEDIDAAFTRGISRSNETSPPLDAAEEAEATGSLRAGPPPPPSSKVTLSGLLNALDGIGAQEGRILFATTNRVGVLDRALTRPGRIDVSLHFGHATPWQAEQLFKTFYMPVNQADEHQSGEEAMSDQMAQSEKTTLLETTEETDPTSRLPGPPSSPTVSLSRRLCGPKLVRKEYVELARQFATAIPEGELSMASLQGYLMMHKTRPLEAVAQVETWVESERVERRKRLSDSKINL